MHACLCPCPWNLNAIKCINSNKRFYFRRGEGLSTAHKHEVAVSGRFRNSKLLNCF